MYISYTLDLPSPVTAKHGADTFSGLRAPGCQCQTLLFDPSEKLDLVPRKLAASFSCFLFPHLLPFFRSFPLAPSLHGFFDTC